MHIIHPERDQIQASPVANVACCQLADQGVGFLVPPSEVGPLQVAHEQEPDKEAGTLEGHCTTLGLGDRAASDPAEVPVTVEGSPVEKQDVAERKIGAAASLTVDSGCCFGKLERLLRRTKRESKKHVNTKESWEGGVGDYSLGGIRI